MQKNGMFYSAKNYKLAMFMLENKIQDQPFSASESYMLRKSKS